MIELGKTYKDRSGNDVRIICVDRGGCGLPIIGLVRESNTYDSIMSYTANGRVNGYIAESRHDLIVPEDYSSYKIDEPVMVRDSDDQDWYRAYFGFARNGKVYTYPNGRTVWSSCGEDSEEWNQCRRPTAEELGE